MQFQAETVLKLGGGSASKNLSISVRDYPGALIVGFKQFSWPWTGNNCNGFLIQAVSNKGFFANLSKAVFLHQENL